MFEAAAYDVIRGTIGQISQAGSTADLGTVTCVENDSPDTLATETGVTPPFGTVYFYLMRSDDSKVKGSYGKTSSGKVRVPASGDCL